MGLLSGFFGGGGKTKLPPMPSLDPTGQWAQTNLYADIQRGLQGQSLYPSALGGMRAAYKKAYPQASMEFKSSLGRLVPRRDVRVRGYADKVFQRGYENVLQGLKEQEKIEPYSQQEEALAMAFSSLSQERKMALDLNQLYNQQQQTNLANQMRFGSYGSNLTSGISEGAGLSASRFIPAAMRWGGFMSGKQQVSSGAMRNYTSSYGGGYN